jgi:DNA primase
LTSYIPEETISQIKNASDILEVVSEAVLLKPAGKNHVGLCPFHSEKTPSFTVNAEKQIFYCFGCGEGGNVITFLMKHNGMTFPEALRQLARRCGIALPEKRLSPDRKKHISERARLLKINRQAMDYYKWILRHSRSGQHAAEYLSNRGFPSSLIDAFDIGFAPDGWEHLLGYFSKRGIDASLLEKAGLVIPRKNKSGHYDRFRNRIVFPIHDRQGAVVGFGGRVLDDTLPKYLNSPETPVYHKSRCLYGLHLAAAACRQRQWALIVEGYLDLMALHRDGFTHAVATLGTALTPEHVRLLRSLIGQNGRITLIYDSDEAGIKAAERSIAVFDKGFVDAQIMVLPDGHDPDTYLRDFGADALQQRIDEALDAIEFLYACAQRRHGDSVAGKMRILSQLKAPLASVGDRLKRALYIKLIAERLSVSEADLIEAVRTPNAGAAAAAGTSEARNPVDDSATAPTGTRMERKITSMMLQFPDILPEIEKRRALDFFENKTLRDMGAIILENRHSKERWLSEIAGRITDGERLVAALTIEDEPWNLSDGVKMVREFVERSPFNPLKRLNAAIHQAEALNDAEQLERLLGEKQKLVRQRERQKMTALGMERSGKPSA